MTEHAELYRRLPQMNEILEHPGVCAWAAQAGYPRPLVRRVVTHLLDTVRRQIAGDELDEQQLARMLEQLPGTVAAAAEELLHPRLRRIVNATGVVVHTNLGRAPWSPAAAQRVAELTLGYLNLELDLRQGTRGGRDRPVSRYVQQLLPGTDTVVVNNNAAAVLLVLNTLAEGREVLVSRGQLVEIGGSFRIPEVMAKGFCRLREVGTTNRTRIEDFRAALGPETGLLLAVHPSNYRVVGFTEAVPLAELVQLGREAGVPVAQDLGSGTIVDLEPAGVRDEPTVDECLARGLDLVTFSGDKLLGGPQAGFVVGKPEVVAQVRANPLYRALRLGKESLLALEATLREYVAGRWHQIPTLAMIFADPAQLEQRAGALGQLLNDSLGTAGLRAEVVPLESRVGGGAAPEVPLPSWGVALQAPATAQQLARRLRESTPPLIGRIIDDRLTLDVRTLLAGDEHRTEAALRQALARQQQSASESG